MNHKIITVRVSLAFHRRMRLLAVRDGRTLQEIMAGLAESWCAEREKTVPKTDLEPGPFTIKDADALDEEMNHALQSRP